MARECICVIERASGECLGVDSFGTVYPLDPLTVLSMHFEDALFCEPWYAPLRQLFAGRFIGQSPPQDDAQ